MTKRTKTPADYLALVRRCPLRRIKSEAQYEAAADAIEPMVGREGLSAGEEMYLDAMASLIERYEEEHFPLNRNLAPAEMLRALMENRGMSVNDLAKVVGGQPLASMILSGRRGISKSNIAKVTAHFRVDPGVFIENALAFRARGAEAKLRAVPLHTRPVPSRRSKGGRAVPRT